MRTKLLLICMIAMTAALNSCTPVPPPPASPKVVVVRPARPGPHAAWADGHWKWSKRYHTWVWVKGHWVVRGHSRPGRRVIIVR